MVTPTPTQTNSEKKVAATLPRQTPAKDSAIMTSSPVIQPQLRPPVKLGRPGNLNSWYFVGFKLHMFRVNMVDGLGKNDYSIDISEYKVQEPLREMKFAERRTPPVHRETNARVPLRGYDSQSQRPPPASQNSELTKRD
jgi:hypothetical protein